jgi:hypothetical protein
VSAEAQRYLPLTALQARVLGVLVEKRLTVPDTYPLTLNALTAGCNQKTSRDPVMNATEAEVQDALDGLRRASLVIESSGGRVMRYAENVRRVLEVPSESVALLAVLALRGPQTAAELRLNCERLQRFSDQSAIEGFLDELANRSSGPLVALLPRQPGARESRWAHLLCGDEVVREAEATAAGQAPTPAQPHEPGASAGATARIAQLEAEVAELRARLDRVCAELGLP